MADQEWSHLQGIQPGDLVTLLAPPWGDWKFDSFRSSDDRWSGDANLYRPCSHKRQGIYCPSWCTGGNVRHVSPSTIKKKDS